MAKTRVKIKLVPALVVNGECYTSADEAAESHAAEVAYRETSEERDAYEAARDAREYALRMMSRPVAALGLDEKAALDAYNDAYIKARNVAMAHARPIFANALKSAKVTR